MFPSISAIFWLIFTANCQTVKNFTSFNGKMYRLLLALAFLLHNLIKTITKHLCGMFWGSLMDLQVKLA